MTASNDRKTKRLLTLALVAGPVVLTAVKGVKNKLGALEKREPKFYRQLNTMVNKIAHLRPAWGVPQVPVLYSRVEVLRDQVDFLAHNSLNESDKARIEIWRGQINKIEKTIEIIKTMSWKAARKERSKVDLYLDTLAGIIVSSYTANVAGEEDN